MENYESYGVGLECAFEMVDSGEINPEQTDISFFEIIREGFFRNDRKNFLKSLAKSGKPVLGHSVEMSLGSAQPFKEEHFSKVKNVLAEINTVAYSDHLCFTGNDGIEIGQLTTLPFTDEVCDILSRNIDRIQNNIPYPFLIENITNRFIVPECPLSETEVINKVLKNTGCGLLLDLNNLYTNSINFGFDPYQWLAEIPVASIMGVHLAGGEWEEGYLYDSHNSIVPSPVWDLYSHVCSLSNPKFTVVEWDQDCPPMEVLKGEIGKAESILTPPKKRIQNEFK